MAPNLLLTDGLLAYLQQNNFQKVFDLEFKNTKTDLSQEHLYVFACPEKGLVVTFDTWASDLVNTGRVHYCWVPLDWSTRYLYTKSGSIESPIPHWRNADQPSIPDDAFWRGYHQYVSFFSEGQLELQTNGRFINKWLEDEIPFGMFLNWSDIPNEHGRDFRADMVVRNRLSNERYATTPDWFKQMVNFKDFK